MTEAVKLLLRVQKAVPRTGVQPDNRLSPDRNKITEKGKLMTKHVFVRAYVKALLWKPGRVT